MNPTAIKTVLAAAAFALMLAACHHPDHHERRAGQPIAIEYVPR